MAIYKEITYLKELPDMYSEPEGYKTFKGYIEGTDVYSAFETGHVPGTTPRYHGIYRCKSCNREIVVNTHTTTFPTHDPDNHPCKDDTIRWCLIVTPDSSL